mmetsp:Transcript_22420/g.53618  ORF Transcript_22420/g.53618 Transcript_22420/m.53618 type:complete len:482 (-) Transcript_22420:221-1666(-)
MISKLQLVPSAMLKLVGFVVLVCATTVCGRDLLAHNVPQDQQLFVPSHVFPSDFDKQQLLGRVVSLSPPFYEPCVFDADSNVFVDVSNAKRVDEGWRSKMGAYSAEQNYFQSDFHFPFYGREYNRFWVGSTGFISFTTGYSSDWDTVAWSFPRISFLRLTEDSFYEDSMNRIVWEQKDNCAVITFNDVPQKKNTNRRTTVQVQLFRNGTITILYHKLQTVPPFIVSARPSSEVEISLYDWWGDSGPEACFAAQKTLDCDLPCPGLCPGQTKDSILYAWEQALGRPSSLRWSRYLDICDWTGVRCSIDGRVVALELPNKKLNGPLPAALCAFNELETLNLGGNRLTGGLPSQWSRLSSLRELYLSGNQINGTLPGPWGSLTRLTHLDVSLNNITGTLPSLWNSMGALEEMSLHGNKLSGGLPGGMSSLVSIQHLRLQGNALSGRIPDSFSVLGSAHDGPAYLWVRPPGSITWASGSLRPQRH